MGTMIALDEIYTQDEIKLGLTPVKNFGDDKEIFACREHYCDNPKCKCTEVMSCFYRVEQNEKVAKELCYIFFDINKPHNIRVENDLGNKALANQFCEKLKSMLKSPDYIKKLKKDHGLIKVRMSKKTGIKLKVGRNEDCICGSGKKYKKCCMVNNLKHLH